MWVVTYVLDRCSIIIDYRHGNDIHFRTYTQCTGLLSGEFLSWKIKRFILFNVVANEGPSWIKCMTIMGLGFTGLPIIESD